jgi:hypothetical protein
VRHILGLIFIVFAVISMLFGLFVWLFGRNDDFAAVVAVLALFYSLLAWAII